VQCNTTAAADVDSGSNQCDATAMAVAVILTDTRVACDEITFYIMTVEAGWALLVLAHAMYLAFACLKHTETADELAAKHVKEEQDRSQREHQLALQKDVQLAQKEAADARARAGVHTFRPTALQGLGEQQPLLNTNTNMNMHPEALQPLAAAPTLNGGGGGGVSALNARRVLGAGAQPPQQPQQQHEQLQQQQQQLLQQQQQLAPMQPPAAAAAAPMQPLLANAPLSFQLMLQPLPLQPLQSMQPLQPLQAMQAMQPLMQAPQAQMQPAPPS
jgi:hypothetical protein